MQIPSNSKQLYILQKRKIRDVFSRESCPQGDGEQIWVLFGGSTPEKDMNEVLVLRKSFLMDDSNFMEITNIM